MLFKKFLNTFFVLIIFWGSTNLFAQEREKRVMLVYSKERNNERIREFHTGFSTYHSNNKTNTRISNLFINSEGERTKSDMIRSIKTAWNAYQNNLPDLIIATDSEALEVLLSLELSPEQKQKILCIKLLDADYKPVRGISYLHTSLPIAENIEFGSSLFPDSKNILIITDNSPYGSLEAEYAKRVIASMPDKEKFHFTFFSPRGDNFEDFTKRINSMPLKSFAILSSWVMDNKGNYSYNNYLHPFLPKINTIPILGIQNLLTGTGVIGGYSVSSWDHGYKAAEASIKLLENPGIVINDTLKTYQLQLDFNELKKWNISTKRFSKQATIINKPPSIFDDFRTEVQLFMAFILLLITSFMVFAVYHFRHRNLNKELRRLTSENISRRELLNNTFSVMEEGVISFAPDLTILYANDAAALLSETRKTLSGKKFHEVYSTSQPGSSECVHALLKEALSQKKSLPIPEHTRIDYHERESRFIAGNISPVLNTSGEVSQIVLVMRDVTELYKQKRYLSLAVESAKAFIWFYNTSTKQFTIVENRENIFKNWNIQFRTHKHFLEYVHPEDRDRLSLSYDKLMVSKAKSFSVEYRMAVNNDNSWEWWERRGVIYSLSSETNKVNDARFLYGMDINIQEIKMRESELLQAKLKAEESDRLKSSFLSNMSHEIRTPLNGIVGFANLITDNSYTDDEKSEFASIINSNSKSLMTLINDILDISRIESNSLKFELSEFDLASQIIEITETSKLSIKEGIEIITEIPESPKIVYSDSVRNRQVITNLLNNSIKFTESGSITVGFLCNINEVEIFVRDTGKGIPANAIEKVFSRFYKTDEFAPGTGLGLPICKAIVEKLGGRISITSTEGEGTRVCFTIPADININKIPAEKPEPASSPVETPYDPAERKRVLIAEDLDSNFMLIDILLSKRYDIARAVNGKEATEIFQTFNPDIILLDIKMPVMNGLEATRYIRGKNSSIPIIALTANAFESDQLEAKSAGCNDVLTKPVKASMLLNSIERYTNLNN